MKKLKCDIIIMYKITLKYFTYLKCSYCHEKKNENDNENGRNKLSTCSYKHQTKQIFMKYKIYCHNYDYNNYIYNIKIKII